MPQGTSREAWAVVPIKPFGAAKKRLAGALTDEERAELARHMTLDVLQTLAAAPQLHGTLVVTKDPAVYGTALACGCDVLEESGSSLNAALEQGAASLVERGIGAMLILPGDLPLLRTADVASLLAALGEAEAAPAAAIVADRHGRGTNAFALTPPDLIAFAYGKGSFASHRRRVEARGAPCRTPNIERLALDIDRVADLRLLLEHPAQTMTQTFLNTSGIATRLLESRPSELPSDRAEPTN